MKQEQKSSFELQVVALYPDFSRFDPDSLLVLRPLSGRHTVVAWQLFGLGSHIVNFLDCLAVAIFDRHHESGLVEYVAAHHFGRSDELLFAHGDRALAWWQ